MLSDEGKNQSGEIVFERAFSHPTLAEILGRLKQRADGNFQPRIFVLDFRVIKSGKVAFYRHGRIFQLRIVDKIHQPNSFESALMFGGQISENFADIFFRIFRQSSNFSARIAGFAVRDFPFSPNAAALNNNVVRRGKKSVRRDCF